MLTAKETRQRFVDFFIRKHHAFVASAPIVMKNDPTLMFTNAGMNQFKDVFLGESKASSTRVVNSQKCLRVSGKHNDLEEVGRDTYHHTMFEMLGNWSFGDYFKADAIAWAWELLTDDFGIDKGRLYATVFGGDDEDGTAVDTEAEDLWKTYLPADHILRCSKKDNFWEMGETGPCGPCSELHIDLRPDAERSQTPGRDLVNQDDPRVIEIWNLVFMEFNRSRNGKLSPLPAKHVDTGMGFERLCMVLQQKDSSYDTDVFTPLLARLQELSGKTYGDGEQATVAFRVAADHIRAAAFTIADGQLPSNTGAGYVIRRILRRAVRYGYSYLDLKQPFLFELVPVLCQQFEDVFPELPSQQAFVANVIREEEQAFLNTLESGLKRLDVLREEMGKDQMISGQAAFELYDTYGFPLDLTELVAGEHGFKVDHQGFQAALTAQRERSRKASAEKAGDWQLVREGDCSFSGYDQLELSTSVLRFRQVETKQKVRNEVVLSATPFYPEGGGQIGDQGYLETPAGRIKVLDTRKENNLIIHVTDQLPQDPHAEIKAVVPAGRRLATARNHSATHLLHAALRNVLGTHVEQRGSYVGPDRLRFDFSHFAKLTKEELDAVAAQVNAKVRENIKLEEHREIPMEVALSKGAMALFGEKYGEKVRMIMFDPTYSVELCGGTHVQATGEIGYVIIQSESGVAAGVRRIEAITGEVAEKELSTLFDTVDQIKELARNPKDVIAGVSQLVEENRHLKQQLEKLESAQVLALRGALLDQATEVGRGRLIAARVDLPSAAALKDLTFALGKELNRGIIVLGMPNNGKVLLSVMVDEELNDGGVDAREIIKTLSPIIRGGGGGQPFYATAGGGHVAGLDEALAKAREILA